MRKIVCELCDGTEFKKENGMFVCLGCGTRYSAEEARGMMREMGGDAPISSGGPAAVASTGNPNQAQIDNILVMATTAYEAKNYADAENYCDKAIELDATCYKAWYLKGEAVGWQSNIDNIRIESAADFFSKAIEFAPEEEKDDMEIQAVEELKKLGLALASLYKNRFAINPDKHELDGFSTAYARSSCSFRILLGLLGDDCETPEPDGFSGEVASIMNEAGAAALDTVRNIWSQIEHPSRADWDMYMDHIGNIERIFKMSIAYSEDDDERNIAKYNNLITALKEPIDSRWWKKVWNSHTHDYDWVVDGELSEDAKIIRRASISGFLDTIAELQAKQDEKKQARIDAYWEMHPDEKAALDAEKKRLSEKKATLDDEIAELDNAIDALREEEGAETPSEEEAHMLEDQIEELQSRRARLGIFAGKEKKQIGQEIVSLYDRIDALSSKIDEEKKAKSDEVKKKLYPIQSKREEIDSERTDVTKKISAVDGELTKDPEE